MLEDSVLGELLDAHYRLSGTFSDSSTRLEGRLACDDVDLYVRGDDEKLGSEVENEEDKRQKVIAGPALAVRRQRNTCEKSRVVRERCLIQNRRSSHEEGKKPRANSDDNHFPARHNMVVMHWLHHRVQAVQSDDRRGEDHRGSKSEHGCADGQAGNVAESPASCKSCDGAHGHQESHANVSNTHVDYETAIRSHRNGWIVSDRKHEKVFH